MNVLLVEPDYRREKLLTRLKKAEKVKGKLDDDVLWYPPLGLMKLSRFHKGRGDNVKFVYGNDSSVFQGDLFSGINVWDRIYISTLFTFDFNSIVRTINFYKEAAGGTSRRIFVGGVMSSLMPHDIFNETGIYPHIGLLTSAKQIGFEEDINIDLLPPDYSILDKKLYAVNDTFYAYCSRGCVNKCGWCGVGRIEPSFLPYIDIKPTISRLREEYGDFANLRLMDNNILASPNLEQVVNDLLSLGFGKGELTKNDVPKQRIVDFNQGIDASFINKDTVKLISKLNIRPVRIAFDKLSEKRTYTRAVNLCLDHFPDISNYMLFNYKDTPRDLYERLNINSELNAKLLKENGKKVSGKIYCYPMRYAPIDDRLGKGANRKRDFVPETDSAKIDWLNNPIWTRRFIRNIEIMKGAAGGAISPTADLAKRAVGYDFEEYLANLYMPEELLRNRNKHEKRVHEFEPKRPPGTGLVEKFREFILELLQLQNDRFLLFHDAVSVNRVAAARQAFNQTDDDELKHWLELYIHK